MSILATVSLWHVAAVAWHLLARREHGTIGSEMSAVLPHLLFIAAYWLVAFLSGVFGKKILGLDNTSLSTFILVAISATILVVSLFRWNQVIRKVAV